MAFAVDEDGTGVPVELTADRLESSPERETRADGNVELRRGPVFLRADELRYRVRDDRAIARGQVRIERDGAVYQGPAAELSIEALEGWFLQPEFDFARQGTRGSAARIDFQGKSRVQAKDAHYTSCPRADAEPDWVLQARDVSLDFAANEGMADGAVLRFLGLPILALPRLSFPVTDARKSGWLPPSINLDSRSGLELSIPYYWNIAPHLDATLSPRIATKRGFGIETEFRYLLPRFEGKLDLNWQPNDLVRGGSRYALELKHLHSLPHGVSASVDIIRVSDDLWWKDFPRGTSSLTPRLLPSGLGLTSDYTWHGIQGQTYLRVLRWQTLRDLDAPIESPYSRSPQAGVFASGEWARLVWRARLEANQFVIDGRSVGDVRPNGLRWHANGVLSLPWRLPGSWIVPTVTLNATQYRTDRPLADTESGASRVIPTFSVDAGLAFERETALLFGRVLRQTLEPRLFYVYTPYKKQDHLPNFDAFGKEFNFSSIYADNAFSGVDRISDAHQITAGVTSRLIEPGNGAELLRLGIAQRFLLQDQRVAPALDGTVDGPPLTQDVSDLLLLGSTGVIPNWSLDAALQYSPDSGRLRRSIVGVAWSPAPFRTMSLRYRLARGLSEQLEAGWQWPLYQAKEGTTASCNGSLYSVGRMTYSLRDSRLTGSLIGLEYDAGCWIGRVVAERLSTGSTEATTRLSVQLELVGLSRLGSNALQVLKDNIPGYRLLRDERGSLPSPSTP